MTLTRYNRAEVGSWSPFRHLSSLRDEIDRLFESPLSELTRTSQQFLSGWIPPMDVHEDNENLYVKLELPGMKKEEIEISIHDGVFTVTGERKEDERYGKAEIYRAERFSGRFQRSFMLPTMVEVEKVKASYRDGILTVTLPKAEAAKPRHINVDVS